MVKQKKYTDPSEPFTKKHHPILYASAAILIGILMGLFLCELTCRIIGVGMPNLTLTGPKQLYIPDPDPKIAFRLRPGYEDFVYGAPVKINEKGLRDRLVPYEKSDDVKRILVLGDSVAFGYGVPVEATFSDQWEKSLAKTSGTMHWEVINSGVPAYTTVQEVRWCEVEGLKYQPDAVIVAYVMNDPEPVHQLAENGTFTVKDIDKYYQKLAELFPKPILPLTDYSNFSRYLNRLLLHAHPNWKVIHEELVHYFNEEIFQKPAWNDCQKALLQLRKICSENDIFLLVAVYPMMYRLFSREDHPFSPHYDRVEQYLESEEIACIVPLKNFLEQPVDDMRAYVDDPHPSASSHAIFAKSLHKALHRQWIDYAVSISQ